MTSSLPGLPRALLACAALALAGAAHASCGSAYCTLMTDRYAQGSGDPHVGFSADLRLELVTQDKLHRGTHDIDASQVTGEDAIERETRNRNLNATLSYGFNEDWSVSVRVPLLQRDHLHDLLDETTGQPAGSERWKFTRLGDVQVLARRQFAADEGRSSYALFGGLKLPTGSIHVTNEDGARAERALQPGTGTVDAVLGAAARRAVGLVDAAVGQLSWTQSLNSREDFKPGYHLQASVGWSHAFTHDLGSVLQLNFHRRGHDRGAEAEPENSGATTVDVSPGLTLATGSASTVYAYLQLPVYRRVTGIQLVASHALAIGWTSDF
jgi:hypothetical protein